MLARYTAVVSLLQYYSLANAQIVDYIGEREREKILCQCILCAKNVEYVEDMIGSWAVLLPVSDVVGVFRVAFATVNLA